MYFENLLLHFSCLIIFPIVGVMIFLQESSARISRSVFNSLACELKTRRICVSSEGEGPSSNGFPVCVGSYGGVSKAWPGKIHWCEQFFMQEAWEPACHGKDSSSSQSSELYINLILTFTFILLLLLLLSCHLTLKYSYMILFYKVEISPLWQQKRIREFCEEKGIHVTAYSPLGAKGMLWGTNNVMECQVLKEIAAARGKSIAQASNS